MTNDQLHQQIDARFRELFSKDKTVQDLRLAVRDRKADYDSINQYAARLGELLQQAFTETVKPDMLPDGVMYEDMARALIEPSIQRNYELISQYAEMVQTQIFRKDGLGLNAIAPKYNAEKTEGIIKFVSGLPYEEREKEFLETFTTNALQVADGVLEENAKFLNGSGLIVEVERELGPPETKTYTKDGKYEGTYNIPCSLCEGIAGTYEYGSEPDEFWARHEGCRCIIRLTFADGSTKEV